MKRQLARTWTLPLAAAALLGLALPWSARAQTVAQDPPAPPAKEGRPQRPEGRPQGRPEGREHDESPLGGAMEAMKGSMRRMNKSLEGSDAVMALTALADFQKNVVAAKLEVPPQAAKLEGAEKDTFLVAYRLEMTKLLRTTCDLEQALLERRMDDAKKTFGTMREMQDPAHERFRGKEEEH